ncbi:hypothetical protein BV20DRAFT_951470 [Pilatotrama ljubarskyi]|nr:hypothetical protein BV20DRAFT_951470 [Pilatotrama ljubarskyi]
MSLSLGYASYAITTPSRPTSPEGIARDSQFYCDHIVFLVENRLFKVPKHRFANKSKVFEDMFALPPGDATTAEGESDDKPVRLYGIGKEEFRALLRVIHHAPSYEEAEEPTMEDWISVLKLTTMWEFASLRRIAIDKLTPLVKTEVDPVRWVCLARRHNVPEWVFPSLHALARRIQALQPDEVEPLGIATVLRMAQVRESYQGCKVDYAHTGGKQFDQYHSRVSQLEYDFTAVIRHVFKEELEGYNAY